MACLLVKAYKAFKGKVVTLVFKVHKEFKVKTERL